MDFLQPTSPTNNKTGALDLPPLLYRSRPVTNSFTLADRLKAFLVCPPQSSPKQALLQQRVEDLMSLDQRALQRSDVFAEETSSMQDFLSKDKEVSKMLVYTTSQKRVLASHVNESTDEFLRAYDSNRYSSNTGKASSSIAPQKMRNLGALQELQQELEEVLREFDINPKSVSAKADPATLDDLREQINGLESDLASSPTSRRKNFSESDWKGWEDGFADATSNSVSSSRKAPLLSPSSGSESTSNQEPTGVNYQGSKRVQTVPDNSRQNIGASQQVKFVGTFTRYRNAISNLPYSVQVVYWLINIPLLFIPHILVWMTTSVYDSCCGCLRGRKVTQEN